MSVVTTSKSTSIQKRNKNVVVIGASNCPFDIDSAILQRFLQKYYIALPDQEMRKQAVLKWLSCIPINWNNFDFDAISLYTDGYSLSDLKNLL